MVDATLAGAVNLPHTGRERCGGPGRCALRLLSWLCALWLLAVALAPVARAEQRFALVIGNSGYRTQRLANPKHDADLIAATLETLGFKVTKLIDADLRAMRRAMLRFSRQLRVSDAVGLFYYAGHGVQLDGVNYLIPIGASIEDESEIPVEGLSLNHMLRTMERSPSRINIAILDACRNNPYAGTIRGGTQGLAAVLAPSGSFIAYATAPGKVAYDGKGKNSPYTKALAAALRNPGIVIEEVFRRTRRAVLAATNGKQTPWESSSLTGEFYFKQKPPALEENERRKGELAARLTPLQLLEMIAWRKVQESRSADSYRTFIDNFPAGMFAELAKIKLARLQADAGGSGWRGDVSTAARDSGADRAARAKTLLQKADAALAGNDLTTAVKTYRAAAGLGSAEAMFQLGRLYDKGRGVPRSLEVAANWYRASAELGRARAMSALGNMYEFGEGVPRSLAHALRLYQKAAEEGDANGMTSLAFLYATGKGVARDHKLARKWYLAGAEKGNRRAMFNLALMQIRGEGGKISYEQAARWLRKAADKGHSGAMRQLAALYEEGKGVARAAQMASKLLLASFQAGNEDARTDLLVRPETWSRATRRHLQKALRRRGVYSGRINGVFGKRTKKALLSLMAKKTASP